MFRPRIAYTTFKWSYLKLYIYIFYILETNEQSLLNLAFFNIMARKFRRQGVNFHVRMVEAGFGGGASLVWLKLDHIFWRKCLEFPDEEMTSLAAKVTAN